MKISYGMLYENVSDKNGFGYAGNKMIETLKILRNEVNFLDPTADFEIWFAQPDRVEWSGCPYRIMYVPWESTGFPDGWVKAMNEADEVWTPSPVVAEWMKDAGVSKPIHVYLHGVESSVWTPHQRVVDGTFNVFHHGAEARRKGFSETCHIFREVFTGYDAKMNFKCQIDGWNIPMEQYRFITGKLPIGELSLLYHQQHLMIYPSWGEGFGLTPLQAMATGMPVLITKGWAPYENLLPEESLIESELVDSPWPEIHPGKMFKPNVDDAIDKAIFMHEHYDYAELTAFDRINSVTLKYNWMWLTEQAFAHLKNK